MNKILLLLVATIGLSSVVTAQIQGDFTFTSHGESIDVESVKEYSDHDLGDVIARKLHVMTNLCLMRYETKVGLSNSDIDIQKPDILRAVEKMDKYYKKAVKRGELSKDDAVIKFSKYLNTAYWIFYEDSQNFEVALSKTKKTEDIIDMFENVRWADRMEASR